jgi:glutaminase
MPERASDEQIEQRLEDLYRRHLPLDPASVASYYDAARGYYGPEAATDDEHGRFAISVASTDGRVFDAGDSLVPFPLQSISKVFAYAVALADRGRERVLERVGVEPSGDAFDSITFDERNHRPHNPMVNAGALVTSALVRGGDMDAKFARIRSILRLCAANDELDADERTFQRELRGADRNRATAYLMRSQGMLDGDVEAVLALYLKQCSVHVTCRDLAVMGATLACGCVNPLSGEQVLPRDSARDVLSVMYTCGMYDAAGQWTYDVGLPAKSGVSGGILVVVPGKGGIAVYSPGLDAYGNSVRGVNVCEAISDGLGLHVFATDEEDAMLGASTPAP